MNSETRNSDQIRVNKIFFTPAWTGTDIRSLISLWDSHWIRSPKSNLILAQFWRIHDSRLIWFQPSKETPDPAEIPNRSEQSTGTFYLPLGVNDPLCSFWWTDWTPPLWLLGPLSTCGKRSFAEPSAAVFEPTLLCLFFENEPKVHGTGRNDNKGFYFL